MTTLTKSYQLIDQTYLGTSGGNLYVRIYAKYSEQDITNNRSYVYYEARSYYENSTYIYDAQGSIGVSGTGANYQSASCTRPTTGESVSVTTSGWVYHNGDGTKTIDCAGSISFPNWGWSGTASGSAYLPTIPRASEISSVSTVNVGETATISVNRKSSSFTHTITYSFGSLSGTVVTKSASASIPWTIPNSFYTQMDGSYGKQRSGTLYITTYNGNTQIGSTKSATFTVRTSESECKPDINATIKDINTRTLNLTGNELYIVNGYSTVEVTYTATPKHGATISQVDANGRIMSSSPFTFTASENEKTKITVTAKDSRAYSTSKILVAGDTISQPTRAGEQVDPGLPPSDYKFIDYKPVTASIVVSRVAPTSDELTISFSGNYFNDTFGDIANVLTLSWKYREYDAYNPTDWEQIQENTLTLNTDYVLKGNTYHSGSNPDYEEEISLGHLFDYRKNYEIQFIYSDKLSNGSVVSLGIKGIPIVNWSDDFFNVNGDIRQYNKSILQPSACKMLTNDRMTVGSNQQQKVTIFEKEFEFGDYECDVTNSRLVIRNTTLCQLSGAFGGGGFAWARMNVIESTATTYMHSFGVLAQPAGNYFHFNSLQTVEIELDPTKTYYVELYVSGYNDTFNLNGGFGLDATWISARRIY